MGPQRRVSNSEIIRRRMFFVATFARGLRDCGGLESKDSASQRAVIEAKRVGVHGTLILSNDTVYV